MFGSEKVDLKAIFRGTKYHIRITIHHQGTTQENSVD